jgi:hypothetical protein
MWIACEYYTDSLLQTWANICEHVCNNIFKHKLL